MFEKFILALASDSDAQWDLLQDYLDGLLPGQTSEPYFTLRAMRQ